jgi:hypothetical protein
LSKALTGSGATLASSGPSSASQPGEQLNLTAIVERAQALTGASGVALALSTEHPEEIECYARSGRIAPPLGRSLLQAGSLTAYCLRSGQRIFCEDAETDPRTASTAIVEQGIRSLVLTPIRRGDEVVGVLTLFAGVADAFSAEHLAHLEAAAKEISGALETSGAASLPAGRVLPEETNATMQPAQDSLATFAAYGARSRRLGASRLILATAALLPLAGAAAWSYLALFKRPASVAGQRPAEIVAADPVDAKDATKAAATLTVEPRAVVAERAESFTFTVTASGVTEMTSAAAQVNYDASLLQFVGLAGGGIFASGEQDVVLAHRDDPDTGVLKISAQRLARGLPGDNAVLSLVFRPRTVGTGTILIALAARDGHGHAIEVPSGHADVTIK